MSRSHPVVPDPPRPLDPLVETWRAGTPMYRVHTRSRGATEFNPGPRPRTRFAFFGDPRAAVLYAAETEEAAVAETLLHDLPLSGGRLVAGRYQDGILSVVTPNRDLQVTQLHSGGLRRLGLRARNLTDTGAAGYPRTVAWAAAAHVDTEVDGVVWMSRQWNRHRALMFFGDRVHADDFAVGETHRTFIAPAGFEWLSDLCHQLKATVMPPW